MQAGSTSVEEVVCTYQHAFLLHQHAFAPARSQETKPPLPATQPCDSYQAAKPSDHCVTAGAVYRFCFSACVLPEAAHMPADTRDCTAQQRSAPASRESCCRAQQLSSTLAGPQLQRESQRARAGARAREFALSAQMRGRGMPLAVVGLPLAGIRVSRGSVPSAQEAGAKCNTAAAGVG